MKILPCIPPFDKGREGLFLLLAVLFLFGCDKPGRVDIGELVEALQSLDKDLSAEAEAKADADVVDTDLPETDLPVEADAEADADMVDLDLSDEDLVSEPDAVPDIDTAECVTGDWKTETGVVSECVDGHWTVRRITKQWGTSGSEYGSSVALDTAGHIYVTGYTYGSLDGNTSVGGTDIFLTKWNADGTKAWTKQWGTSSYDYGSSVVLDTAGNIYVTGYTRGSLDGNANAGYNDIFLTKWNANGTKAWTKQWGMNNYDEGYSVALDTAGNIYVTGDTIGSLDGNANAGNSDIFLSIIPPE